MRLQSVCRDDPFDVFLAGAIQSDRGYGASSPTGLTCNRPPDQNYERADGDRECREWELTPCLPVVHCDDNNVKETRSWKPRKPPTSYDSFCSGWVKFPS
jgi:hypothetical protein